MDHRRFDDLMRAAGAVGTRRQGLAAVLGLILGGAVRDAFARDTDRGTARNGGARSRPGDRTPRPAGPCGDRTRRDNACTKNSQCCTGYCAMKPGKRNKDGKGRCRCIRPGKPCTSTQTCCKRLACLGGVCGKPVPPPPACDATICPTGCCQDGVCKPGSGADACGAGGAACVACADVSSNPICEAGACLTGAWVAQAPVGPNAFNGVWGVTISADGLALYISDAFRNKVYIWTRDTASDPWQQQTDLGTLGDPAEDSFIEVPYNLALSTDELEMYIACSGADRICLWTRASTSAPWAAQPPIGSGLFSTPSDVALSADGLELYVADTDNNRIAILTRETTSSAWQLVDTLGNGWPTPGTGVDQFALPAALALSPDGLELYVANTFNNRISVWTRDTASSPWQATGSVGSGPGSANNQLSLPKGIALSSNGLAMYIGDNVNNRIAVWTRASTAAEWQVQSPIGSGYGANDDQFNLPIGVALSTDDKELYVADNFNYRIAVWYYIP